MMIISRFASFSRRKIKMPLDVVCLVHFLYLNVTKLPFVNAEMT